MLKAHAKINKQTSVFFITYMIKFLQAPIMVSFCLERRQNEQYI